MARLRALKQRDLRRALWSFAVVDPVRPTSRFVNSYNFRQMRATALAAKMVTATVSGSRMESGSRCRGGVCARARASASARDRADLAKVDSAIDSAIVSASQVERRSQMTTTTSSAKAPRRGHGGVRARARASANARERAGGRRGDHNDLGRRSSHGRGRRSRHGHGCLRCWKSGLSRRSSHHDRG